MIPGATGPRLGVIVRPIKATVAMETRGAGLLTSVRGVFRMPLPFSGGRHFRLKCLILGEIQAKKMVEFSTLSFHLTGASRRGVRKD